MKVNNPEYEKLGIEPLETALRDQVGIRLDPGRLEGVWEKTAELFERQKDYQERNIRLRNQYIANYGRSGEAGGKYIIESLKEKAQERKRRKES